MKRKVPDYKKILTPNDLELNTCSNQDCTGLIPTAVKNPAEADSYEELYPYISGVSPHHVQEDSLKNENSNARGKLSSHLNYSLCSVSQQYDIMNIVHNL